MVRLENKNEIPIHNPKVEIPLMIQDPTIVVGEEVRKTDGFHCTQEENYFDGPISDRVAVLDFDHKTGKLHAGVKFLPAPPAKKLSRYDVPRDPRYPSKKIYRTDTRKFNQASVFGTVLRTMKLFEGKNVLGHPVHWAFDGPQLLVVPRAGVWANAFYHRNSRSLQFFFFQPDPDKEPVYTSLSRDIVAHETAHAILDGIAPDLYHALTPESLGLHEAVADLTAVMMAAESQRLVTEVLKETRGAVVDSTILSSIAPQFGQELDREGKTKYLRQLVNDKKISDVPLDGPHELSEVLSGALFSVLMKMHEEHRQRFVKEPKWQQYEDPMYSCSGAALNAACFRLRNSIFQALEYLPPGEVSFADYGRAILAVDNGGNLNPPFVRDWIREEFVRREIVDDASELDTETTIDFAPLKDLDFKQFSADDALARNFVEEHREFLHIPSGTEFTVYPRQDLKKDYFDVERNQVEAWEILLKVSWEHLEPNKLAKAVPELREVRQGTTLVIDVLHKRVQALLTSDRSGRQPERRDRMFKRLWENGLIRFDNRALRPDGESLESVVQADTSSANLRIRGTAAMFQIAESEKGLWEA